MRMPETSVYKYCSIVLAERYIWPSRKFEIVKPESEAIRKKELSNYQLWKGVD